MKFVKKYLPFFVLLITFSLPAHVFAQLGDPGCSPDDPCPIDSGVLVLIAVVMILAIKKVYDIRRRKAATV